jgi:hypothetical protein
MMFSYSIIYSASFYVHSLVSFYLKEYIIIIIIIIIMPSQSVTDQQTQSMSSFLRVLSSPQQQHARSVLQFITMEPAELVTVCRSGHSPLRPPTRTHTHTHVFVSLPVTLQSRGVECACSFDILERIRKYILTLLLLPEVVVVSVVVVVVVVDVVVAKQ